MASLLFSPPFCVNSESAFGNDFSNKLICPSVAPKTPSGPGPTSFIGSGCGLCKRQAREKGPEKKLAGGRRRRGSWINFAFQTTDSKREGSGREKPENLASLG